MNYQYFPVFNAFHTIITAYLPLKVMNKPNVPSPTDGVEDVNLQLAYQVGDVLPDGWIVGPVCPVTGKSIAIEPVSGSLEGLQAWHEGEVHALLLREEDHMRARQPDNGELRAIYNSIVIANRNINTQFNTSRSGSYYWSGTSSPHYSGADARIQYFGEGGNSYWDFKKFSAARVRFVRDEPDLAPA